VSDFFSITITSPNNPLVSCRGVVSYQFIGGIAGALEAFIMFPTEYVKTQIQLEGAAVKKAKVLLAHQTNIENIGAHQLT
jgi:hypothetical protein